MPWSLPLLPIAAVAVASSALLAQRGPAPDPLVKENWTVMLAPHLRVPDDNVSRCQQWLVVVDSARRRSSSTPGSAAGTASMLKSRSQQEYRDLHRLDAFPCRAHDRLHRVSAERNTSITVQEAEFEQGGMQMVQMFSGRSPATAEILKDAARRPAAITFDRTYELDLGGVRVRFIVVGPTHTRGDTTFFVEGDNVLFAGDVVMNNSFLAASAVSSMKAWLAAFDTLDALKPKTVVRAWGRRPRLDHYRQPHAHAGHSGSRAGPQGRGPHG